MLTGVQYCQRIRDVLRVKPFQFRNNARISYAISVNLPTYAVRLYSQALNLLFVRRVWPRVAICGNSERYLRGWDRRHVRPCRIRNR